MSLFDPLWRYTRWANEQLLAKLESCGERLPSSSLRLLSHIMNAQSVWASRLNGDIPAPGIWDQHDLATCQRMNAESLQILRGVVDRQIDNPDATVGYKTSTGMPFVNTVTDVLLQVFNHGTYHRAQIAMDLRQNGIEPVNTDYIIFIRVGG